MKTWWLLVLVGVLGVLSLAADWPQWRGPHRNGVSQETGLLKEWPAAGPKLLWQLTDIDFGYSTPAVVGDRLYLLSNKGMDDEFVQALQVEDGKRAWVTRLGKVGVNGIPPYPGARSTPTVDGELLFALSSNGELACLQTATGKVLWHKNVVTDFAGRAGTWAYAESPLVDGDVVVCTPGGTEATLVALNKKTGEIVWKAQVPGGDQAAYASAIVVEAGGVKQYVQFLQKGVVGVDAKTGKFLWRYDRTGKSPANIPTPVAHDGCVYTSSAMAGGGLVRLKVNGDTVEAEPVYFDKNLPVAIGGSVLVGKHLYGTNARALLCVEFTTGKVVWQDKCVGTGSVCYADGRLYVHGENNGEVALVEATPEGYHLKGHLTPPGQPKRGPSKAWAYPVVANGRLYVRDLGVLWCYDVKDAGAGK
jgi:outer membrane protein assembly factor BamB